jgi:hypothetical protein
MRSRRQYARFDRVDRGAQRGAVFELNMRRHGDLRRRATAARCPADQDDRASSPVCAGAPRASVANR